MDKYKKKFINLEIIGVSKNNKRTSIIKMENVSLTKQNSDRLFEILAKDYGVPDKENKKNG